MTLSIIDWHNRFQQQASWTVSIREYLLNRVHDCSDFSVLEVGCGTGAVLENYRNEIRYQTSTKSAAVNSLNLFGIDINQNFLAFAKEHFESAFYSLADGISLPFKENTFDITYTHFLFMWLREPVQALKEIVRVTKPGCLVFAFGEPDYGGRIDYPEELEPISEAQINSLYVQGADPFYGRKLSAHFIKAGLVEIEMGVLGGNWSSDDLIKDFKFEWQFINSDLNLVRSDLDLDVFRIKEENYRSKGERVLFVPTFYASGKKPKAIFR